MAIATHIVIHPFDSNGKRLENGTPVDASGWKNTEKLVACKYLRPINPGDRVRASAAVDSPKTFKKKLKLTIKK